MEIGRNAALTVFASQETAQGRGVGHLENP